MELPFSAHNLIKTTQEAIRGRGRSNYSNVTAILPAKKGGSATTIATNAAAYLARAFGKKVLVVECDLQSARDTVSGSGRVLCIRFQKRWSPPMSLPR